MPARIWTVAKHELRGYFDQPTAYVLAVAFLAISLFLLFRTLYASGVASLRPLFDLLPLLFAIFIPAVTMRSLAEERRARTLEWLMAQPLTESEVVQGKFLGDWLFVLIVLAGTVPTAVGVLLASSADPGIVLAQYVGAAFLAAQFVALGVWASSVTRNQITAFIVGAGLCFLLFLVGLPVVQIGLPPVLANPLARLSVVSHFENVARGVVDLRDALYFVSTTVLFLVLATGAVARERLSRARSDRRRLRVGAAVVAVLVLVVNLLGGYVRGRLDLTANNVYTLADGTREILGELDDLVRVTLFASDELPSEIQLQLRDVRDLLADMRGASNGNLEVRIVDPDDDEDAASEASSFGIFPLEFQVLRDDEFQVRRGYYGIAVTYAEAQEVIPVIERVGDLELRLVSAIAGMTTQEKRTVTFVQGAGAKSPYTISGLPESLTDRYDLQTVDPATDSLAQLSPDSVSVLVVAAPNATLDPITVSLVESYADAGGATLLLVEPVQIDPQSPMPIPVTSGLEPLLEARGVSLAGGLVYDLASSERVSMGTRGIFNLISAYPLWPIVLPAEDHPTTRGLSAMSMGWAGALEVSDSARVVPIWQTTEAGGIQDPGSPIMPGQDWDRPPDQLGVRTVAVAIEADEEQPGSLGRMVVVADGSFTDAQFVQNNPSNLAFLANAIDWLAQDEALMSIRAKDLSPPMLVFASDVSQGFLKWGNLVGAPLVFAVLGLLWISGRRKRAEARWSEVAG